jgi:glycosyltransferase involved in cell wall biosynthesis
VEGARNIAGQAKKHGVDAEILCQDDPKSPWLHKWPVPVCAIGAEASTFGYSKKLDNWLAENITRYDALIVHGVWMYFSNAARKAATRNNIPYYLFIHGALDPWFKNTYPRKHLKKVVYWRLFEHKVLRDAAGVLFTSEEEKILAKDAFQPYRCRPVVVGYGIAPPPVNEMSKHIQERLPTARKFDAGLDGRRFILYLGRIHEKKGIDLLIQGFAKLKQERPNNLALVIAGPGDPHTTGRLQALGNQLGVSDSIVWTGPLYGESKWLAMRAAEVFAMPSHQENFGISVVEALACGTPVLISNKVNIWREVDRDSAGFVDNDDVEGTARLLRRWYDLTPEKKAGMSANAAHCFSSRFDITRNCRQLFALLRVGSSKYSAAS